MIVPLDEHDVGAGPRRGDGGSGAGGAAAGHQYVAIAEYRHKPGRFADGRIWPLATLGEPPGAEHLGLEEQPPAGPDGQGRWEVAGLRLGSAG